VGAWRRENPEPDQPLSPVERARVKELEDEVARLRMENEFLKKAAADSTGRRNTSIWRCAHGTAKRVGSGRGGKATDAVAGPPAGGQAGGPAAVLGGDRAWAVE